MHNIEPLIADWRKTMTRTANVGHETLDELESHLRETIEQFIHSGVNETEAFERAVAQLGPSPTIASEFQKLNQSTWLPIKVGAGISAVLALGLIIWLSVRLDGQRSSVLLATHIFTVTLGYTATLVVGGLGICYVCQRCLSDFSPFRLQSLSRFCFAFSCAAVFLTGIGIALAMLWARREWGRSWAWDPKETGALCVIVWQICFLFAPRLRRISVRGLLVASILGNIIVSLAWFGSNLLSGLHGYGTPNHWLLLLVTILSNLAFFVIGLMPAGWLRLSKA